MTQRSVAIALFGWTVLTSHVLQGPAASAGSQSQGGRAADLAAIETFRQQDIAATLSGDPVALTDLWTDDAIRLGAGAPAEVGKQAIRESNERLTANKGFNVLSYVPETKDFAFLDGGWAVEWRPSRLRMSTQRVARRSRLVHCAVGAQEAPGRQLEVLPPHGGHRARCYRQSRRLVM